MAHTVSRVPCEEATTPAPGVLEQNKSPEAAKPPGVAAWEEVGGMSPLAMEDVEIDQLRLSPTSMSLWESEDAPTMASAAPKPGGKPISMMKNNKSL